jgi:hypothetical protein
MVEITGLSAKAAHVNMMTDTIIANMPPEGLRSIMRGMLGGDPKTVSNFHRLASDYLENTRPSAILALFTEGTTSPKPTAFLSEIQRRYRCLMGCGYAFESMELLIKVVQQTQALNWDENAEDGRIFMDELEFIDGDIVQTVTAVQKALLTSSGLKPMEDAQAKVVTELKETLSASQARARERSQSFAFERGLSCLDKLIDITSKKSPADAQNGMAPVSGFTSSPISVESVKLGTAEVPRIFMGLWQFSSPAWGTASKMKIDKHFRKHVDAGLIAYGMWLQNLESLSRLKLTSCRYGGSLWRCRGYFREKILDESETKILTWKGPIPFRTA